MGDQLTAFFTGKIGIYKVPRYWKVAGAFPTTVTGKIQKFKMRELSIAELSLGDAAAVKTA